MHRGPIESRTASGTWLTPARACWGEPPQLSTENHLRKEFEGLDHSSLRNWLFDPLDQELCVIWEPCVIDDGVRVSTRHRRDFLTVIQFVRSGHAFVTLKLTY